MIQKFLERRGEILQPQRVLRVYKTFGDLPRDMLDALISDHEYDQQVLKLFRTNGFQIIKGGRFNPDNPLEICFSDDSHDNLYKRNQETASKVGIDMPKAFTPHEILQSNDAVVAKLPGSSRGRDKYLLETKEQKVRFIAWALLFQEAGELYHRKNRDTIVRRILEKVNERNFRDHFIQGNGWLDSWVFEEHVDSPGDYNTSFRVVTDCWGNIHYSQLARSSAPKGTERALVPKLKYHPLQQVSIVGTDLSILLTHPDSPFYLAPKKFVSNVAAGGKPLLLDGRRAEGGIDRKLLLDMGIDPNQPELPGDLVEPSQKIGKEFRRFYSHVGIDYLRQRNGSFVLLEVNKGPNLRPEALGLSRDCLPETCELEMMRRVIKSLAASR